MGGQARFPYPKQVWSPAGGWWVQPSNWKSNTAISFIAILGITFATFKLSASKEYRYVEPTKPIPSMMWTKQYKDRRAADAQE